jgi:hypothetical protein
LTDFQTFLGYFHVFQVVEHIRDILTTNIVKNETFSKKIEKILFFVIFCQCHPFFFQIINEKLLKDPICVLQGLEILKKCLKILVDRNYTAIVMEPMTRMTLVEIFRIWQFQQQKNQQKIASSALSLIETFLLTSKANRGIPGRDISHQVADSVRSFVSSNLTQNMAGGNF